MGWLWHQGSAALGWAVVATDGSEERIGPSRPLCSRSAAVNTACFLLFLALPWWACVSQNESGSSSVRRCRPGSSLCRAVKGWGRGQQLVPQQVSALPPAPPPLPRCGNGDGQPARTGLQPLDSDLQTHPQLQERHCAT